MPGRRLPRPGSGRALGRSLRAGRSPRTAGSGTGAGATAASRVAAPRVRGGLAEAEALPLLQLLVRLAEALLSSGAPAADVTTTTLGVARAGRLPFCQVDVTYTSVTVSTVREDGVPLTAVRVVPQRDTDYARLAHLYALARSAEGQLSVEDVTARLAQVLARPRMYRRGTAALSVLVLAGCVAVLLGAGWATALAAAATSGTVLAVLAVTGRRGLPPFFQQAAGAFVATLAALGMLRLQSVVPALSTLQPSLVVGAGVVVLLAGLSLVESAEDAISGYYVTAGARAFETLLMTTGLVVGIAVVLDAAQRSGMSLSLADDAATRPQPLVAVLAAGGASAAWAVSGYAGRRAVVVSALAGMLGWEVLQLVGVVGLGPTLGTGAAALAVGYLARRVGPALWAPQVVVSICGIVPLLPGLAVYRAIAAVVAGQQAAGAAQLVAALGTGLALAAGTSLGTWMATSVTARFAQRRKHVESD